MKVKWLTTITVGITHFWLGAQRLKPLTPVRLYSIPNRAPVLGSYKTFNHASHDKVSLQKDETLRGGNRSLLQIIRTT
jgi:hypothetical protein